MPWLLETWRRLRALRRRDGIDSGLDEEIQFHLDRQTEKNIRAGMSPEEARRQALIRFGGVVRTRESARDEFRLARVEDGLRDLRHGLRALRRTPGFTAIAILMLALGIGATTTMFSVVSGVLLRPLPYPEQDRLIELVHEAPGLGISQLFASPAIYFTYRDHARTFESVGLWDWDRSPMTVTGAGDPEAVPGVAVTHEVLPILGATPVRGRVFADAEDRPGHEPTVVISFGYWQRRFAGADPLGQILVVDGIPRRVIGILPPSFRFFDYAADIFYPLQPDRSAARFPGFNGRAIARVKPGITLADANADVARMIPILQAEYGQSGAGVAEWRFGPTLQWLRDSVVGSLDDTLWMLMGTIGLLLAIACANVANLVLVRTEARQPELAIRAALGGGRTAAARVVLAESVILGLAGGAAGVAVAAIGLPLVLALGAADLPQVMSVRLDRTALLMAAGTSMLSTILFALVPLAHVARRGVQGAAALRGGSRTAGDGRESQRTRQALLTLQVALALVLLTGAGLMIRTARALHDVNPGFEDPDAVLTFQLTIPDGEPPPSGDPDSRRDASGLAATQGLVDALAALPGVQSAAFSAFDDGLPLDGDGRGVGFCVESRPATDCALSARELQLVSPGFFETLRTPIVAGRTFGWIDLHENRPVALVSENLARAQWPSATAALGHRIGPQESGPWFEIVGVVAEVYHDGLHRPAPDVIVLPAVASATTTFVVRSDRVASGDFLQDARNAVWSVNPNLALAAVRTLGDLYRHSMGRTTLALQLLTMTGVIALLLGLVGAHGSVGYMISLRRHEIGVRLALGARSGEVQRMFVRRMLIVVGAGVAIGLGAVTGLTPLMESQLFGVSRMDPLTHLAVALVLLTTAAVAGLLSARRVAAVDPVTVLRGE